jgi:hypothetical protein
MGVPTLEVGYPSTKTGRGDHEVHKGHVVALEKMSITKVSVRGFGGLGVACWHLVPKFAGSNPAEAVGFFRAKKSSALRPSEGT